MNRPQKTLFRSQFLFRLFLAATVLLGGVGVCGAYRLATIAQKGSFPTQNSSNQPQSIGVGALGRLEPGWKVFQIAPSASAERARVESLLVEEGDELHAGALLAVLDTNNLRLAAVEEAKAQVLVSKAKLAQVKSGNKPEEIAAQAATVEQLKASLRRTESDFKRAELMSRNGALSAEEFDQKQTQVQIARATLRQSEATLAAFKTVRPEDITVAEAELAKANAGVTRAQADLDTTQVRSPISGRVLKIHARPGEKIGDAGLLEIGDTTSMHAVAEVYESDVPRIKLGQKATVHMQSFDAELSGEVVQIGWKVGRRVVLDNDPVKDTDARVVEVRVKLDGPSSAKVAGLSYARIEVRIAPLEGR